MEELQRDKARLEEAVEDLKGELSFVTAVLERERQDKSVIEKEEGKKT